MPDPMMQAIQLRGRMPQEQRQAEAVAGARRVAVLAASGNEAHMDEADGALVALVHAGVRPTELFLAIVAEAVGAKEGR